MTSNEQEQKDSSLLVSILRMGCPVLPEKTRQRWTVLGAGQPFLLVIRHVVKEGLPVVQDRAKKDRVHKQNHYKAGYASWQTGHLHRSQGTAAVFAGTTPARYSLVRPHSGPPTVQLHCPGPTHSGGQRDSARQRMISDSR